MILAYKDLDDVYARSIRTVLHPHAEGVFTYFFLHSLRLCPFFFLLLILLFHDPAQLTQFFFLSFVSGNNSWNFFIRNLRFYIIEREFTISISLPIFFPAASSGQMRPFDKVPINNGLSLFIYFFFYSSI